MTPKWIQTQIRPGLGLSAMAIATVLGIGPVVGQTTLPLHPEEPETATVPEPPAAEAATDEPSLATDEDLERLTADLPGQTITQVLPKLTRQGWTVLVRTPRLVQLEQGQRGLDLSVDPGNGEVTATDWIELQ